MKTPLIFLISSLFCLMFLSLTAQFGQSMLAQDPEPPDDPTPPRPPGPLPPEPEQPEQPDQPKPEQPKDNAPPVIWKKTDARKFDSEKELQERSIFEDWIETRQLGEANPMAIFFYWPAEDKKSEDKKIKSQAEKSEEMEKSLDEPIVRKESSRFYCFKVDTRELKDIGKEGEAILKKYGVKTAPTICFFDYKGGKQGSINASIKSDALAKKFKEVADKSDKMKEGKK